MALEVRYATPESHSKETSEMKRLMMLFSLAGAMTAALATDLGQAVRVQIPFDFVVCDRQVPAGEYTVRDTGIPSTVAIHQDGNRHWATFHPLGIRNLEGAARTMLVFEKIQDKHFLREVWIKGRQTGLLVPQGKMQRNMVVEAEAPVTVVAAAR